MFKRSSTSFAKYTYSLNISSVRAYLTTVCCIIVFQMGSILKRMSSGICWTPLARIFFFQFWKKKNCSCHSQYYYVIVYEWNVPFHVIVCQITLSTYIAPIRALRFFLRSLAALQVCSAYFQMRDTCINLQFCMLRLQFVWHMLIRVNLAIQK